MLSLNGHNEHLSGVTPFAGERSCVLTLKLDDASQEYFDALRTLYFPPERNHIAAHLTLFHQLPARDEVQRELEACAEQSVFTMTTSGVYSLGKGVAFRFDSGPLHDLHLRLSAAFQEHLSAQDRQPFRPHVVVQNKVAAAEARALLVQLQHAFRPRVVEAVGLDLWLYLGGPWEHLHTFLFRQGSETRALRPGAL